MSLTPTADKVIAAAEGQIGYHEGRSGSTWTNHQKFSPAVPGLEWSQNQAWCATFVSWCALQAGVPDLFPRTASTDIAASWYQARKQWSEYPAIGAQGFLSHGSDEFHTFIVVRYDETYLWTIEGNTNTNGSPQGDGVYALRRRRRDTNVEGYGYPAYPEGIVSADPAWAHKAPRKTPAPKPVKEAPVSTGGKTIKITVSTNNLKSLPKNIYVDKTLRATPRSGVQMVQEADLASFHNAVRHTPGYLTGSVPAGNTFNAFVMFKPSLWSHTKTYFVKQYDGAAGVSLTRHIAVSILRNKVLERDFVFISYHRVTAGNDKVRRRLRAEGDKQVRKIIKRYRKAGAPIILGTDQNGTTNLFPSRSAHARHGIDHIYVWNSADVTIDLDQQHSVDTASDHNAFVVDATITKK